MRVWLDDKRIPDPVEAYDIWVKRGDHCMELIRAGMVSHLSFDHDLSLDSPTGHDVALLVEKMSAHAMIRPFTWSVHSMNPVGAKNIRETMESAERYWGTGLFTQP